MTKGRENVASEAKSEGLVFHPMDQFIVKPFFGEGPIEFYTFTNVAFWMVAAIVVVIAIMVLGTSRRAVVPSRSQSIAELAYGFVYKMVEDVTGKDAVGFFPYIMTLFMFIVTANFLGLIPTSFTTTSHFAVTAILALSVFLTVTIVGFVKNGAGFLGLFWVSSAPLPLRPILAVIELISYFVRPVGGSRGYQSVRRLCCDCNNRTRISRRNRCDVRTRNSRGLHSGIRVYHSNLCVLKGCIAPIALRFEHPLSYNFQS
jgi:F-type H+-transporting ATPase subunit a